MKAEACAGAQPRLLAIGDSMIQRWPRDHLDALMGGPVLNLGVGRDRTQNTLWRLREATWSGALTETVLLWIGVNNVRAADHAAAIAAGVERLVDTLLATAPQARVQLLNLPPFPGLSSTEAARSRALNDILATFAGPRVSVIDLTRAFETAIGAFESDRLHISEAGYAHLSAALRRPLRPAR